MHSPSAWCATCHAPMPPDAVSEWWCGQTCQTVWYLRRVNRPADVYGQPDAVVRVAADVQDMRAGRPLKPVHDLISTV